MSFFGSLPHGLGSHVSPTSSHFPREKLQDEISPGPELGPLGGRVVHVKSSCTSHALSASKLTVLGSKGGLKLLSWEPRLLKGSLVGG